MSAPTQMPTRIAGWVWTINGTNGPILYDTRIDAFRSGLVNAQCAMQEDPALAPLLVGAEYVELADEDIRAYMALMTEVFGVQT